MKKAWEDVVYQIAPSEELFLWAVHWIKKDIKKLLTQEKQRAITKTIDECLGVAQYLILQDMGMVKSRITGNTAYQIPNSKRTKVWNEAITEYQERLNKLKVSKQP